MTRPTDQTLLAFDVGEKRIGVARADTAVRIAFPITTVQVDGNEFDTIRRLIDDTCPSVLVVGRPRNQSGDLTAQTRVSERFVDAIASLGVDVVMQDESLTSVAAEDFLKQSGKPYTKADIDARAAAIILEDYLREVYGY